jgi:hypothetical protein
VAWFVFAITVVLVAALQTILHAILVSHAPDEVGLAALFGAIGACFSVIGWMIFLLLLGAAVARRGVRSKATWTALNVSIVWLPVYILVAIPHTFVRNGGIDTIEEGLTAIPGLIAAILMVTWCVLATRAVSNTPEAQRLALARALS